MIARILAALFGVALLSSSVGSAAVGDLRPFVRGSWKQIGASYSGKPAVVHFWGVTCGPCRVEMPHWGELLKQRSDLNLVTINADFVPDDPQAVVAMLDKNGLISAENWIFADGFVERLRFEIDPSWQGEIPLTILIARDGTKKAISGVADLNEIRTWLDGQKQSGQ